MDDDDEGQNSGGVTGWISSHAIIAILIAVVGSILLFAFLSNRKQNQQQQAAGQGATGDLSGLATDANGNHIVYLPVENMFENLNTITGSYNNPITGSYNNPVTTNTTTTTDTAIVNHPTPPPAVLPPPPHTTIVWNVPYTVKLGDTLRSIVEAIGDRGVQITSAALYAHNKHTIDAAVAAHHGHPMQLYPGEVLVTPVIIRSSSSGGQPPTTIAPPPVIGGGNPISGLPPIVPIPPTPVLN